MWAIRILAGQQAGKIYPLKPGRNVVGRSPECDVTIVSAGVSKQHAIIEVSSSQVTLLDNRSSNGSFVNGVEINQCPIRPNDKIALHDTVIELIPASTHRQPQANFQGNLASQQYTAAHGQAQHQEYYDSQAGSHAQAGAQVNDIAVAQGLTGFTQVANNYIESVILPGVYKLSELFEFKWVLAMFMGAFIVLVTALSTVPLVQILKSSIQKESQARAQTIARNLADKNRSAIMQGLESALSVTTAMQESGVDKAYIISNNDGQILAPAKDAGSYPDDPFVHSARKVAEASVEQISDSTIGVTYPISFFDSSSGTNKIHAYAVVFYNMGSLAIDDSRTLSLFIQTLFIALLVGSILFFFLYSMIKKPIHELNKQIDEALKERSDDIEVAFDMPIFQHLVSNVRSTLSRAISGGDGSDGPVNLEHDRNLEMSNIIHLVGYPALVINGLDYQIVSVNSGFEETTGLTSNDVLHHPVGEMRDQSLRLSIEDLISRLNDQPDQLAVNQLEFSGINHEITAQAIWGTKEVAYFIIAILPVDEGGYE